MLTKIQLIQQILSVVMDGKWGPRSQSALDAELQKAPQLASSFADPADVRAFQKCKMTGRTDIQCFVVGDNGIGQFGANTAQDTIPMVAVHSSAMIEKWGSVEASAHQKVKVTANGKTIEATVEDRISAKNRIDLNPACAKLLGLTPPFLVPVEWEWA